jgi:hypothetical protein
MSSKSLPTRFPEKETIELKVIDPLVPEIDASLNVIINSDIKKPCKGTKQQCPDLGFNNKKAGHLISRKLRNRNDTHLSSIGLASHLISRKLRNQNDTHLSSISPIEIDEGSDPEIEDFLVREDPELQGSKREVIGPTEPYDFVTNFPPCLKGKEGFSGIMHDQKKTTGKTDTSLFDYALHRHSISLVQCDVCFHWVERYYTNIPLLQSRIKTLAAQNDLLRQENHDLKEHAERKAKRIKRSANIVIKNATSVKAIINSELPDPSLVKF